MLQRYTVQKLHGDERLPVLLANVVNRADIRMVQCGRGLGFALEPGKSLRVAGNFFWKKLEGDKAMQPRVLGFIDDAHAAAAQFFNDAIVRNGLPNH